MSRARIIFVPGLKPKPPPELYRPQLVRVLAAALERVRPLAAARLRADEDAFVLVSWTYLFYGSHRDIGLDLPGIDRLLSQPTASEADRRELASWPRRIVRLGHSVGDAVPLLGRLFARPAIRASLREANRYLRDRHGIGTLIRALLERELEAAWSAGDRVLLIGHSLGSVIAYDALWELADRASADALRCVDLFVTLGSPLATHFMRRRLAGPAGPAAAAYPPNVRRWVNFAARGDNTALRPRLAPFFKRMVEQKPVEAIEDHVDLENAFRGSLGLNVHEAYGYLSQPAVAEVVGDWLERD